MIKLFKKLFYCRYTYVCSTLNLNNDNLKRQWRSQCGASYILYNGLLPGTEDFIYCPNCGRRIYTEDNK